MSPTPETAKTPDETPIGNVDGDVDKYENLMLTPNGSIVAMIGDKELKPETDPDWEARQAERRARAKRKREVSHTQRCRALGQRLYCGLGVRVGG